MKSFSTACTCLPAPTPSCWFEVDMSSFNSWVTKIPLHWVWRRSLLGTITIISHCLVSWNIVFSESEAKAWQKELTGTGRPCFCFWPWRCHSKSHIKQQLRLTWTRGPSCKLPDYMRSVRPFFNISPLNAYVWSNSLNYSTQHGNQLCHFYKIVSFSNVHTPVSGNLWLCVTAWIWYRLLAISQGALQSHHNLDSHTSASSWFINSSC